MTGIGYSIPDDLTTEILLRLLSKSLFRFRCVSKTWCSLIRRRQFVEAYMSMSLSRPPRLLLSLNPGGDNRLMFFSSSSSDQSFNLSTMVATKNNTLTMSKVGSKDFIVQSNSVRGFVCCSLSRRYVACNPNTRQVIPIPEDYNPLGYTIPLYIYLGYDHINDQYKVLRVKMRTCSTLPILHSVWTLGGSSSSSSWRRIKSSILYYCCEYNGVCIDGVVYYEVSLEPYGNYMAVSSFDVASEQIRLIKTPEKMVAAHLTNYLGKLAAYDLSDDDDRLILWVLDDVKNQVWSKRACIFSSITHSLLLDIGMYFAGITAAGEVVYVPWTSYSCDPLELFFYHVESKVERRVRIEGLAAGDEVTCFASLSCSFVDNIIYL
ncbi:unnamed protein product [Eruca vesicaria subsp. sativa]|uniref:F-box domain-containing protein n=1 Tax=Eruca vesicaria subsp. sativa TaxID=29727 RepID=A0ABC8IUU0_ERUVS|nr:unnamed protein product [Eruca vesicaria subsp. sativa]